jgi:DNA-binding response OmpR family regulator
MQRATLGFAGYEVAVADNDTDALRTFIEFRPDLVLLDLHFDAGTDGITISRRIRDVANVPIVFLSASEDTREHVAVFDEGADDFISKRMATEEQLARIRAVLQRTGARRAEVLRVDDLVVDISAHVAQRAGQRLGLTKLEFSLLVVLLRQRGRVLSKDHLLREVWGFDGYNSNVVEVHLSALRQKLEATGPRLIHTVHGVGYIVHGDEPGSA